MLTVHPRSKVYYLQLLHSAYFGLNPQQKLKFNFPIGEPWTQPFVTLLNGETEEIILREKDQLILIATAIAEARNLGASGEELNKLTQLSNALFSKIDLPGTKAQLKPVYSKRLLGHTRKLTKLTLVFKWGGEVSCYLASYYLHIAHLSSLRILLGTNPATLEKT
jgi:hypothetical protein